MKKVIRLTENELIKVIKKLIKENDNEMTRDSERFGKNVEDNGMIRDLIVWTPGYEMEQLEELFGTFLKVKEPYEIEDDDISPKSERYKYYVVDLNFNKLKELLNNKTRYTVDDPYDASGYFNIEKDGGRAIINFDIGNDTGEIPNSVLKSLMGITESKIIKVIKRLIKENDDDILYDYMRTLDYIAGQFDENTTEEELEYILDQIEYEIQSAVQDEELTDDQIDELVKYGDDMIGDLINQNQLDDMPTYKTKWQYSDKDNQK
jgi:hypothetical protein